MPPPDLRPAGHPLPAGEPAEPKPRAREEAEEVSRVPRQHLGAEVFWGLRVLPNPSTSVRALRPWSLPSLFCSDFPLSPLTHSYMVLPRIQQEIILFCYPVSALLPTDHVSLGNFLGLSGPPHPHLSSVEFVVEGKDSLAWWLGVQVLVQVSAGPLASCVTLDKSFNPSQPDSSP